MDITENNAFDAYAGARGWAYDNGGGDRDQFWDWYAGRRADLVLLRQAPDRVVVVRFEESKPTELWPGRVSTGEQFDEMLNALAKQGK